MPLDQSTELRVHGPRSALTPGLAALLAALLLLAVAGGVSLAVAVSHDRHLAPGAVRLDRLLPPDGARLDGFAGVRTLGVVAGFGRWRPVGGSWVTDGGAAHPTDLGTSFAVVDPGPGALLVHVDVVHAAPRSGVVVDWASPQDLVRVVVDDDGRGWTVERVKGHVTTALAHLKALTDDVVVRIEVRPDHHLHVGIGGAGATVALPADLAGRRVGMVADGPAARFDDFAYLPARG